MDDVNPHPPAYVPPPFFPYGPPETDDTPGRRPWRRTVLVAALTAVVIAALGGPLGVLWHYLSPGVPLIDVGQNGIVVDDPSPEEYIAAEGWFTLLGVGFGVAVAVAAWLGLRRYRGPALLVGVAAGALGAAPVAWQLGRRLGLGAYQHWRDTAVSGATYHAPPDLHAYGTLLVPAFAAAIVMTLLAGWSNDPSLDRPGARPGYGNNNQAPFSSATPDVPDPTAEPAPPAPGPAAPPHE